MIDIPDPFVASTIPLSTKRFAPGGYRDYTSYKPWLRDEYHFRCAYCLAREAWTLVAMPGHQEFSVDHVNPKSQYRDQVVDYNNLVYACLRCNREKGIEELPQELVDQAFASHICFEDDHTVSAITEQGVWLRDRFKLDSKPSRERRNLLRALRDRVKVDPMSAAGATLARWFEYPQDIPDLGSLSPPIKSSSDSLRQSAWERRERGELPRFY